MYDTKALMILSQEDVKHIKEVISLHCNYDDKVMNRLEDFLDTFKYDLDAMHRIQIDGSVLSIEEPQMKQMFKQRIPNES